MMLRDDFNGEVLNNRNWKEIYGGGPSDMCGIVVSGKALLFHKVILDLQNYAFFVVWLNLIFEKFL